MEPKERSTTSNFCNSEGQNIFYRKWMTNGKPKGIIVIVHGLNSHSGYYQRFATLLTEQNYEVFAIDLCGRGNSDGERYFISDYREVVADIDRLINIAKSAFPNVPLFLLGHSAGGVFAAVYAVHHQAKLKGLISESIAFQLPAPSFAMAAIKFLSHIIPHIRLIQLNNRDFSRDKSIVDIMNNDPLIVKEKQPIKTMQQLFLAAEHLKLKMPEITLPLLLLHGTADKVTKPDGSIYFMEHASSADKELKLYEGHYHDLLNDKYNEIIQKDLMSWLNERS